MNRWRLSVVVLAVLGCIVTPTATSVESRPISGGTFEASGVEAVDGTAAVLFVDDGRRREVFYMDLSPDGAQHGEAIPIPLAGTDVTDLEGMTSNAGWYYVVGSQSKRTGFNGDGLVRFRFDPATRRAGDVERVQGLKRWLAERVPELEGTATKVGDRVLNIEAIAWDPQGQRLLLGLRTPVIDGNALVIPLKFRNPAGSLTADNLEVDGGKAIRVPLGGSGIRSLEFDERANAFHLIAGAALNREDLDFRVMEWNGLSGAESHVQEIARFPRSLKPEGITGGRLNGQAAGVIVFDTGRFAILP